MIAQENKFNEEKYGQVFPKIYDSVTAQSMMNSLKIDLEKLDWSSQENVISNINGLKTAYIGSGYSYLGSPWTLFSFLKKTCLYSDTVIISDDTTNTLMSGPEGQNVPLCMFSGIVNNAINLLAIENLFTSDTTPPICVLAPPLAWLSKKQEFNAQLSNLQTSELLTFSSELFARQFDTIQQLKTFLSTIPNFNHFSKLLAKPELLIRPTGERSCKYDFARIKENLKLSMGKEYTEPAFYYHVLYIHKLSISGDLLTYGKYRPVFATDFQGIWQRLMLTIKRDNENINEIEKCKFVKEQLIIGSLQQEELKWLGNVPINKLKELRERGELEDLRALIGNNIGNIEKVSDEDFFEVGKQVRYNIDTALRKHSAEIQDLNEKYRKKYNLNVGSAIVTGTLGFLAAVYPPLAVASAIVGGGSIVKTYEDYIQKRESLEELKRKSVAMLFDAKRMAE